MLFFAMFTLGYFFGVFSALAIFPPRVREIEEQEKDALTSIIELENKLESESKIPSYNGSTAQLTS